MITPIIHGYTRLEGGQNSVITGGQFSVVITKGALNGSTPTSLRGWDNSEGSEKLQKIMATAHYQFRSKALVNSLDNFSCRHYTAFMS